MVAPKIGTVGYPEVSEARLFAHVEENDVRAVEAALKEARQQQMLRPTRRTWAVTLTGPVGLAAKGLEDFCRAMAHEKVAEVSKPELAVAGLAIVVGACAVAVLVNQLSAKRNLTEIQIQAQEHLGRWFRSMGKEATKPEDHAT